MIRSVLLLAAVLALQACSTTKSPPLQAAAAAPASEPAPRRGVTLIIERQWLQQWFAGTPVTITQRNDGPVSVDVPREFCFDAGRSNVKPALAAVLDKLAESLRRTPQARLLLVAAPADNAAASPLPLQRAEKVRSHLLGRGVPALQLASASVSTAAAVQLRMDLVAAAQ